MLSATTIPVSQHLSLLSPSDRRAYSYLKNSYLYKQLIVHTAVSRAKNEQNSKLHVTGHLMHFTAMLRAVVKLSTIRP